MLSIPLPEYNLEKTPNYPKIAKKLHELVEQHFEGQNIAIRGISLTDHPAYSPEQLIETILNLGTDRYDSQKAGVAHDFYQNYDIDLFAVPYDFEKGRAIFEEMLKDFYEGALEDRGYRLRLDLLLVYNLEHLLFVPVHYEENDFGNDAFRFKNRNNKTSALKGILRIL